MLSARCFICSRHNTRVIPYGLHTWLGYSLKSWAKLSVKSFSHRITCNLLAMYFTSSTYINAFDKALRCMVKKQEDSMLIQLVGPSFAWHSTLQDKNTLHLSNFLKRQKKIPVVLWDLGGKEGTNIHNGWMFPYYRQRKMFSFLST